MIPKNEIPPLEIAVVVDEVQPEDDAEPVIDENDQFMKYVWNKQTKRLEKRDMRIALNDKIDKRKYNNFSKVNEKSRVLCM